MQPLTARQNLLHVVGHASPLRGVPTTADAASFEESRAMLLRTKKGKDAALSMLESIGTSFVAGPSSALALRTRN